MRHLPRLLWTALLALGIPLALAGCGGDSGGSSDDGGGDNAKFVGTWALTQAGTQGITWYILFNDDNSWLISDTANGSAQRVYGTYAVEGDTASGPMVNPGTGTGEIIAELDGDTLSLDFVEFWHTPAKHILYTGSKL